MPALHTCFLHLGPPLATLSQLLPTPGCPWTLRRSGGVGGGSTALNPLGISPLSSFRVARRGPWQRRQPANTATVSHGSLEQEESQRETGRSGRSQPDESGDQTGRQGLSSGPRTHRPLGAAREDRDSCGADCRAVGVPASRGGGRPQPRDGRGEGGRGTVPQAGPVMTGVGIGGTCPGQCCGDRGPRPLRRRGQEAWGPTRPWVRGPAINGGPRGRVSGVLSQSHE